MDYLAAILLLFAGIFLILLVLIQRGRGGGLAGAFGGMGGQSAFGTKAGDVFTKITVVAAVIWVLLAGACIWVFSADQGNFGGGKDVGPTLVSDDEDGGGAGAGAGGMVDDEQEDGADTTEGTGDSDAESKTAGEETSSESSETPE